jgi:hypothetical protein
MLKASAYLNNDIMYWNVWESLNISKYELGERNYSEKSFQGIVAHRVERSGVRHGAVKWAF